MNTKNDISSLELLLDTMCNTFGGVMFIAISLVVILSMVGSVQDNLSKSAPKDDKALKREIEMLTASINSLKLTAQRDSELRKLLENDPRRKRITELAAAVSILDQLNLKLKKARLESDALSQDTISKLRQLNAIINNIKSITLKINETQKEERDISAAIDSIRQSHDKLKMTFKVIKSSDKTPFFILVKQNKFWLIGPLFNNNAYSSDDATLKRDNNNLLFTVIPGRGKPLLAGKSLSNALYTALKEIPGNRCPSFAVDADSAAVFNTAREILKKRNVPHGWNPHKTDFTFGISLVEKTDYEY